MTQDPSTVSVVIPTYNRRELLRECLRSVRAQTVAPAEIIVVDDGSTDGTAETLPRDFPGVRFILLPHSGLPAVARNAGLAAATGTFAAFCDSDDLWEPAKLERQLQEAARTQAGLVCCDAALMGGSGRRYLDRYRWNGPSLRRQLIRENFVITSSVLLRRSGERQWRFSEDPRLRAYEDYELWLRVAASSRMVFLNEPLVRYRVHDTNISAGARSRDARSQRRAVLSSGILASEPLPVMAKLLRTVIREFL